MKRLLARCLSIAALLHCTPALGSGDSAVRLTMDDSASETDPDWSPDGKWIAYTSLTIDNVDLYMIGASGGSPIRITTDPSTDADPSWSPEGGRVVYRSTRGVLPGQGQHLWIHSIAGGTGTQVTFSGDYDWNPAWSPAGDTICFARGLHTYERTLWIVEVGGAQESQLIDGVAHTPAWSPDGAQIAFAAKPAGFWHLFVVSSTGGAITQVTPSLPWSSYVDDPTWSPDGQHIAYVATSQSSPQPQIWIIAASGGQPTQLTHGDGTDKTPAWSPDGTKVAFSSNRQGGPDIWVIPVTTTSVEQSSWSAVKRKYQPLGRQ